MREKTKVCLPADHVTSAPHLQAQVFHQGHATASCHRDSAAFRDGTSKCITAGDFSLPVTKAESRKGQSLSLNPSDNQEKSLKSNL